VDKGEIKQGIGFRGQGSGKDIKTKENPPFIPFAKGGTEGDFYCLSPKSSDNK
jgi:hypothetical protein